MTIEKKFWNTMKNNIIINKSESIKKCLQSIRENYNKSPEDFLNNQIRQDAAILNLQRASQTAIDMAAHLIRKKFLAVPQESAELFSILEKNKILTPELAKKMRHMVGFRNIAVHEYQALDMNIVVSIIKNHLTDFELFIKAVLALK